MLSRKANDEPSEQWGHKDGGQDSVVASSHAGEHSNRKCDEVYRRVSGW